jgi:phosphatidylglycerol---prolipoprotein diacylglyceryl transferase
VPSFTWDIDPVLFKLGPLAIRYYSLLFVGVFLGGYAFLKWQIVRGGGDEEDAGDFIVYGVIGVLVGSRLGHVIFYDLDKALKDPFWVLQIWEGGLASHGAVIGLILAMWLFTKRRGIPFLEGSDRFAFSAALGATLVRVGNFFNSEIVGRVTDQSWGVKFPRYDRVADPPFRHPSQLYEVALGLFILGALYLFDKRLGKEERPRGALISLFFLLYFPGRFLIEFVKEFQTKIDETTPLTMGQYLSIPGALLGLYGLWWSFNRRLPAGWVPEGYDDDDEEEEREADEEQEAEEEEAEQARAKRDPDVEAEFGKKPSRLKSKKRKKKKPEPEPAAAKQEEPEEPEPEDDEAEPPDAPADSER